MSFKYREIAEILKVIDASDCDELMLETAGMRLVVRRQGAAARVDELIVTSPPATRPRGSCGHSDEGRENAAVEARHTEVSSQIGPCSDGTIEVRAPMVGTFYRAPSPTETPFVEKGDRVKPGQALGLIEVMKLFTTIEATIAGRIKEIPAENATLVEYGQVLFVIEPESS